MKGRSALDHTEPMTLKRNTYGRHATREEKISRRARDLKVARKAEEDQRDMDVSDAFTERLDGCEHRHMRIVVGMKEVTNEYPDEYHKEPRSYNVRRHRVSLGPRGTTYVYSCQCKDYKFRCLPTSNEEVPDDEEPPEPLDVPPRFLGQVLDEIRDCKHIRASKRDGKPWQ